MALNKKYYIHTANGKFKGTTQEDLDVLFQTFKESEKNTMVLHFHGGLVNYDAGMEKAQRLFENYHDNADAYPVFFIWEAGPFEAIRNNLGEILNEKIFNKFLKHILRFMKAKFETDPGKRSGTLHLDSQTEIRAFLEQLQTGTVSLDQYDPDHLDSTDEFSVVQIRQLENELKRDKALAYEVAAIIESLKSQNEIDSEYTITRGMTGRASVRTLMSPSLFVNIRTASPNIQKRSSLTTEIFFKLLISVAKRVIRRYVTRRHHGFYVTIVEEILREFYIDNLGAQLWNLMKNDTADTFKKGDTYAGTAFLKGLQQLSDDNSLPKRIVLVGHSTGAIFICNLLKYADEQGLHSDITFDLALLAPACTFKFFDEIIVEHLDRIDHCRMFSMNDSLEKENALVPVIYPSSLLYFISGILEGEEDKPLLGMQRFFKTVPPFNDDAFPGITRSKVFLSSEKSSIVWSIIDNGEGMSSNATSHGGEKGFDYDSITLESLEYMIKYGYGS